MKLRLINFLCYTDKSFEFGDSGMTLLSGPSGTGKTTCMRGILFALFGDGTKVQSYGKTSCSVELEFEDLKIVRTKRPNRLVLNDIYEDDAAQKIIDTRFGDTFRTSGYIQQNNLSSFILMNPTDKLEFLEKFAFKDVDLGKIKGRCKAHIQTLNDELTGTISELNVSREFVKEMEPTEKVEFPIKCGKSQHEKAHKNEIIRHKNCITLIKKTNDDKNRKERELNDLNVLNATLMSRKENLESITVKLLELEEQHNSIAYKGDDYVCNAEKNLNILIAQRELIVMEDQYTNDMSKLEKMRIQELGDFEQELTNILALLWKEYAKEDLEEQKNDIKTCISDLEKVNRLKKDVEDNYVDLEELESNKNKLCKYTLQLEEKQELHRKLEAQKEIYKCPSCNVSLRLIEERLALSEHMLDEDIHKCNTNTLSTEIQTLKRDILKLQRIIPEKENKVKLLQKYQKNIDEILNAYDEDMNIDSLKEDLEYLHSYQAEQLQQEKRKKEIEYNISNEVLSRTYNSFKHNTEKLGQRVKLYKSKITEEVTEKDEELLRSQIEKEKRNKDALNRLGIEKKDLESNKDKCISILNSTEQTYLDKYGVKHDKHVLEQEIQECKDKIGELEEKRDGHNSNLQQIELWEKYQESIKKNEGWRDKVKVLELKEKEDRSRYAAAMTLKDKILEAESIAITNIINTINMHARGYLDCFFDANPISVQLQSFKESKKTTKPCINIEIEYKGMECDLNMLSGGELSRIVLAFTLALAEIFNTPMIMLDECTASLDQDLTSDVFEGIKENFKGKLVLVIAHQIIESYFDKVIKLTDK